MTQVGRSTQNQKGTGEVGMAISASTIGVYKGRQVIITDRMEKSFIVCDVNRTITGEGGIVILILDNIASGREIPKGDWLAKGLPDDEGFWTQNTLQNKRITLKTMGDCTVIRKPDGTHVLNSRSNTVVVLKKGLKLFNFSNHVESENQKIST